MQNGKRAKGRVEFKNSFEVAIYNDRSKSNKQSVITDRNKQSLLLTEYKKLLTTFSLEQYVNLGFGQADKYSIYMAYKHILNIYNLLLEERGLQPVNIDLHPVVRLNNNNNARILNKYYTDELYIEKIQILYAILNTPPDNTHDEIKKTYILRKRYKTLEKYTDLYKFNTPSTKPMDDKTKHNIYICYGYIDHILNNILPAIKSEANKAFIESLAFLYDQLAQRLTKIIKNYDIQGPEINEYKDILITFENIALQGLMPENKILTSTNMPAYTPKVYIDIHSPKEYNSSMKGILFIDYNY